MKSDPIRLEAEFTITAPESIEADGFGSADGPPTFSMIANTGAPMSVGGFDRPVVVDFGGVRGTEQSRPILKDHKPSMIVGHSTSISIDGGVMTVAGVISGTGAVASDVIGAAKNGFPWQASVGMDVISAEGVAGGDVVTVNGSEFEGPLYVARATRLREVSVVAIGADDETSTSIAAEAAGSTDVENPTKDGALEASKATAPAEAKIEASVDAVADIRAAASAEAKRIGEIQRIAASHADIAAEAIDGGWDEMKTENAVLRAKMATIEAAKNDAPAGIVYADSGAVAGDVIEAGLAIAAGVTDLEKSYDESALNRANDAFRGGLGLHDVLINAARSNGYTGRISASTVKGDTEGVLRAAFSNSDISGILSNVQNKSLRAEYDRVESTWRDIAAVRRLNDFKESPSYTLTGDMTFKRTAPGGKLEHAALGEESFGNKAETRGRMLGITREQIINDDLGALNAIPATLGRGAAHAMNDVLWTEFLDDASFFSAGNSSLLTGAGSALGIDGLIAAEAAYHAQTTPDGKPLGIRAAMLLVPPALHALARQLYTSTEIRSATGKTATANPLSGLYRPVMSTFLSSATAWYLLADPADIPTIEVGFLNGRDVPVIESADADFDTLGIQFRAYFDFGVRKQNFRGGIKNAGA